MRDDLSSGVMDDSPSPTVTVIVCEACRQRPAVVTLDAVDYCAPCAPMWHPSFDDDVEDLALTADELLAEHGIPVLRPEPVEAWTDADRAWAVAHGYLRPEPSDDDVGALVDGGGKQAK